MNRWRSRLVGIVAAGAGVAVPVALGTPLVAIGLSPIFGVTAWLLARYHVLVPETDSWATQRWNALWTLVIVSGVFAVQNDSIGVPIEAGIALSLVVGGVAFASFLLGIVVAREAAGDDAPTPLVTD
ncbi:hypothetical protein [Halorientalis salina]|uniref:hypothetical protein n=1 Tax=Halorientalis salina TaxID=2932266 RepID=UPI0010AD8F45|nr:hypothetical protein [Halorientalis salina]